MKWITNADDPRLPASKEEFRMLRELFPGTKLGIFEEDWKREVDRINQHTKGRPKGTTCFTVEQLEEAGMIGLYEEEAANVTVPVPKGL